MRRFAAFTICALSVLPGNWSAAHADSHPCDTSDHGHVYLDCIDEETGRHCSVFINPQSLPKPDAWKLAEHCF